MQPFFRIESCPIFVQNDYQDLHFYNDDDDDDENRYFHNQKSLSFPKIFLHFHFNLSVPFFKLPSELGIPTWG